MFISRGRAWLSYTRYGENWKQRKGVFILLIRNYILLELQEIARFAGGEGNDDRPIRCLGYALLRATGPLLKMADYGF